MKWFQVMSKRKNSNKSLARVVVTHKSEALLSRIEKDAEQLKAHKGVTTTRGTRQLTLLYDLTVWTREGIDHFTMFSAKIKECREYSATCVDFYLPVHWTEYYDPGRLKEMINVAGATLYVNDEIIK